MRLDDFYIFFFLIMMIGATKLQVYYLIFMYSIIYSIQFY